MARKRTGSIPRSAGALAVLVVGLSQYDKHKLGVPREVEHLFASIYRALQGKDQHDAAGKNPVATFNRVIGQLKRSPKKLRLLESWLLDPKVVLQLSSKGFNSDRKAWIQALARLSDGKKPLEAFGVGPGRSSSWSISKARSLAIDALKLVSEGENLSNACDQAVSDAAARDPSGEDSFDRRAVEKEMSRISLEGKQRRADRKGSSAVIDIDTLNNWRPPNE